MFTKVALNRSGEHNRFEEYAILFAVLARYLTHILTVKNTVHIYFQRKFTCFKGTIHCFKSKCLS